jgi:hypothetical protein
VGANANDSDAQERFQGFADATGLFFKALAKNQDREWFAAHKSEYEERWAKPMALLLDDVQARIYASYPNCELAEPNPRCKATAKLGRWLVFATA